jgi:hypothetical protein
MTAAQERELFRDYYTEEEVAKLMGIAIGTLRNRLSAGKDHPPMAPGRRFPKDEFSKWEKRRLKVARN